jgi:uncharacterized integral membrane protein
MRIVVWLLRVFIFLALFAFALNNQQAVVVHGLLGLQWEGPLVWVVLLAFASGAAIGALVMLPRWWRKRSVPAPRAAEDSQAPPVNSRPMQLPAGDFPPRVGL